MWQKYFYTFRKSASVTDVAKNTFSNRSVKNIFYNRCGKKILLVTDVAKKYFW